MAFGLFRKHPAESAAPARDSKVEPKASATPVPVEAPASAEGDSARAILERVQEAEDALGVFKGVKGGRLNVSVISAGDYFFPPFGFIVLTNARLAAK